MRVRLVFMFLSVCMISHLAAQPAWYTIKKSTWYETIYAVREARISETARHQKIYELSDWMAIGPFQTTNVNLYGVAFEPETKIDLTQTYQNGTLKWEKKPGWADQMVHKFTPEAYSVYYLYRTIRAQKTYALPAFLGSDDGLKVWLNGTLILERNIDRACEPDQDMVTLALKKGENQLLLKINNNQGDFGFYFALEMSSNRILWQQLAQDFNDDQSLQEMAWENQDSIWYQDWKPGDLGAIIERYQAAYQMSCEDRLAPAEKLTFSAANWENLNRIRAKYLESKKQANIILTPKPGPQPRINGPKVFAVRPGHPFLFTIPATGERPMKFSVKGLPPGLTVDQTRGLITGVLAEKKTYEVLLVAENALGHAERGFKIVVGDTLALTPPMGWNSWNCFACAVDDEKVRSAAEAMVKSGLIQHGWSYINIDDCWEIKPETDDPQLMGEPRDAHGMINTNQKFPDMRALGDFIHQHGLKMGIYSSPGPLTCAGFTASYQHEAKDARQYANWGVDYLKYDWCSYGRIAKDQSRAELMRPYQVMRAALNQVDRDIVFSLCQYGMGNVWEWGESVGGNCWRTTGDIVDTWESLSAIGFSQNGHEKYAGPGHWNDPDMLVVGYVGWGPQLHPTRLTPNEQYTHISLWCLLASPLLIGCDMTRLDDFTLNLLTNDEVLAVNQDPLGRPAGRIRKAGNIEIWARTLEDGSKAVGLFNLGKKIQTGTVTWAEIGISGEGQVRDLWRQQDLGRFTEQFTAQIPRHGVVLIKVTPVQ